MRKEALDKFRFSRGQKLTVVWSKFGLLIPVPGQFAPITSISGSKIALKAVFLGIA